MRIFVLACLFVGCSAFAQVGGACSPAEKPLASFRSGTVTVPGGSLYYEVQGTGSPLVLIHGGYNDRRLWDDEFHSFAQHFRVVRYDIRGYGKSASDGSRFSPLADLEALLDSLKITKTSLVGLSLGGMVAAEFAVAHPDRVDRLVLAASGLRGIKYSNDADQKAFFARMQACETHECSVNTLLSNQLFATGMKHPCYAQRARQMVEDNWKSFAMLGKMDWPEPPMAERLGQIKAPTLILIGDSDDKGLLENADIFISRIPGAKRVTFPGVSHHLNMEIPQKFDEAVLDFFGKK
jgi:pimeloyl-ACP methyl ester carboxylesterase